MERTNSAIRVWYRLTASLGDDAIAADRALLSPDEVSRSARFRFAEDRRDFIAAHGLLRRALSALGPADAATWRFETGAGGKPALTTEQRGSPPVAFNLSHTRGLVACIVAPGREVGVDVERVDRAGDRDAIAARFFHASETAYLCRQTDASRRNRFAELWTLKEAYLKATGAGLSAPLCDCAFAFGDARELRFQTPSPAESNRWNFGVYAVDGDTYRLAVAYDGEPPNDRVSLERFEDNDPRADPPVLVWTSQAVR